MSNAPALSDNNKIVGPLWSLIITPPDIVPNPRPYIAMHYIEFAEMARKTGYGDPVAITQINSEMVFVLPRQNEIYFWFREYRLFKITQLVPNDDHSWINNEISPIDSIVHPAF